mgnify:CR=1 FL=1
MASPIWDEKRKKWRLRVTTDGQTKTFTSVKSGLAGKKEVLRRAREWENNGSTNAYKTPCKQVWNNFIQDYSERVGATSEGLRIHQQMGRLFIIPALEHKRIGGVTKRDLQAIINNAKPQDKRKKVLSKKYIKSIRGSIVSFMKYAYENGYCEPIVGELYVPKDRPTIGKTILQPHDIRKLFEPSDMHYHKALCFLAATGVRPGEALGLKWSDIKGDEIFIQRAVNFRGYITEGKTENARRIIPLNAIIKKILDEQREATKHLKSEWIFCDKVGGAGNQHTMYNQLTALGKERGFKNSLYEMRHTFASLLKDSTLSEFMMKQIFGHSSFTDTFGIYGHLMNGDMQKAAEIIELKFKDISQETGE